jgi:hypothetical protein
VSTGWVKAGRHKALRGQVVDFLRAIFLQQADHAHLVEQVALDNLDAVLDVADAVEIDGAGAAHHTDDRVALFQQEFGEIAAVLTGDAGDQCCWHSNSFVCWRSARRQSVSGAARAGDRFLASGMIA